VGRRLGAACACLLALGALAPAASALPDARGWELVSPAEKNGGEVARPGALLGGAVLQAAAAGGAVTYSSASSFGQGAQGAPPASQYIATRTPTGWSTENITPPLLSGSYGTEPGGVPYRLFSTDLGSGLLLNGRPCRGEGEGCPVANPPLPGTDAPAGYQNYYLRDNTTGAYEALLGPADIALTAVGPEDFEVTLAGASADLRHVVLSSCAALTPDAVEVLSAEGCDPAEPNLYLWSAGSSLELVNVLPAQSQGDPGAALAARGGAVSEDGSRVYWTDLATGNLYLREGAQTKQVDAAAGGGGTFETASADGATALYAKAGHLYRYLAATETSTDLTPGGGVLGVLGASTDASRVYYQDTGGLKLWSSGNTTQVAPGAAAADPGTYPAATGAARVSADGASLLFVSEQSLTGYDNTDQASGEPDAQVFLYEASAGLLRCLSCRPDGVRPLGPSTIPGALANGQGPDATHTYKPRALVAGGNRVFFDSEDAILPADLNDAPDVYQWEAQGVGSCALPGGCVELISSGRSQQVALFVDASADGADAFFLTDRSLTAADPSAVDLYDARIGGGFPEPPPPPVPCVGDACQRLIPEPEDPTLTTLLAGRGNPAVRFHRYRRHHPKSCRKGKKRAAKRKCAKRRGKGTRRGQR
jgi:hypothetical protein